MPRKEFKNFLNVFQREVKIHAYKYIKDIAKEVVKEAKEILESQRYNHAPLSKKWITKKVKHGLDTRILIASGFYQKNIAWGTRNKKIWFGVKDVMHPGYNEYGIKSKPIPLIKLARIHEFGYGNVPARPLWRPLISKHIRQNKQFANRYKIEIQRAMKKARKTLKPRKVKLRR